MDLSKIKNNIPALVKEWGEKNARNTGYDFVDYLQYRYGEVVARTFAMRRYAKKGVLITEVRRRAVGKSRTILKNLLYCAISGYIPVLQKEDKYSHSGGYSVLIFSKKDFDLWYYEDTPCCFYSCCINPEILLNIDEFKYCGYQNGDVIDYLRAYRNNPTLEFFGKLNIPLYNSLITKAKKDKQFQKFLFSNADVVREYGPAATIGAYKSGETIPQTYAKQYRRRCILKKIPAASNFDINIERFEKYCEENEIDYSLYNDYLEAIVGLELDLKDTKNLFPKEFMRLYDLRVAEYGVTVINKDKVKLKKFYDAFAKKGQKATAYEMSYKGLCIVAPRDLSELKVEGKVLGHCVGNMGYDKRMVDGQILIMFVRKESDISTPFVTVEYDIKSSKIKQAYGRKNTAPPEEVTILLDKWLKMMKKLQKQKKVG